MKHGERTPSTSRRKGAVIAMYGCYLAAALLWGLGDGFGNVAEAVAVILLLGIMFGAMALLFRGTRYWRWGNAPDPQLDEYQIATRGTAYRSAYTIVAAGSLLGLFGFRIARDQGVHLVSDLQHDLLFWGWFLLVMTLPAAILAWTERPVEDEEEPIVSPA